jgi:antitoxin (DNA-binding transcriptional repressor) of toxin-antitoxin stability system
MQVSIRERKANPANAIAQVQQGVRVQITSHRKVVAFAPGPKGQTMSDLVLALRGPR